jgi:hypothetical protein
MRGAGGREEAGEDRRLGEGEQESAIQRITAVIVNRKR